MMNIEIANRLVRLRKQNNMSQEALAEKIGISRQAVSKWERAEASPDTDNLILLAHLYGVSLDELLRTEEDDQTIREESAGQAPLSSPERSYPDFPERWDISSRRKALYWLLPLIGIALFIVCGLLSYRIPEISAAYPLICSLYYLWIGFCFHIWHPGWIIYLTIPLFYVIF